MVSANYIVGLTDGEGCFYVLIKSVHNKAGGALIQLNLHLKLQAEDKILLDEVKKFMQCGNVCYQNEKRLNHSICYRYTVNSHRDIIGKIIPFFQTNVLKAPSKLRNFILFCEIATLVQQKRHLEASGLKEIRRLKSQMNHGARVVRESRPLRGNAK